MIRYIKIQQVIISFLKEQAMYINKIIFDWDRLDEGSYLR